MKNIYNIFYAGMLLFGIINLASCSEDDEFYDFPGDSHNRVYLMDQLNSYRIIHIPVITASTLEFETALQCTQRASGDIQVTVEIDNSLIEAYNEDNETEYEAIPAASLVLENTTLTIPAGALASTDMLRIKLSEDQSIITSLTNENGYLIPLRITSAQGENTYVSENVFSTYIIITTLSAESNINDSGAQNSITGTLVDDQSGWTVTVNNTSMVSTNPLESLLDGDAESFCAINNSSEDIIVDINMGKSYTFDGISFYYAQSNWWGGLTTYGSCSNGMTIQTSNDGITWESDWTGTITRSATTAYCVFYVPVTAQYIRIIKPKGNLNNVSLSAGVFNVYEK